MVLAMTGVVIQLKALVKNFFLYRHEKGKRLKLYDLHTVTGVMTLPYAVMYALTGLMFNLGVLFYAPTMMLIYDGDQKAMFADAGFVRNEFKPSGRSRPTPAVEPLIDRVEADHRGTVDRLAFHNYGDESGIIEFQGRKNGAFAKRLDAHYEINTDTFPEGLARTKETSFTNGILFLFTLHMARFGGAGVRLLFFALALAICGMIVAGNLLWIHKRQKQTKVFKTSLKIIRGFTLGGCVGVVVATGVGFLLERVIPVHVTERHVLVQATFWVTWGALTIAGFFAQDIRRFIARSALATSVCLGLLLLFDLVVHHRSYLVLWQAGFKAATGVTLGLAASAVLLYVLGRLCHVRRSPTMKQASEFRLSWIPEAKKLSLAKKLTKSIHANAFLVLARFCLPPRSVVYSMRVVARTQPLADPKPMRAEAR